MRLTAIQSQIFHECQVDEYAQALRKLLTKAYTGMAREGPASESIGQTVLFITGLKSGLKAKVVGIVDQLVVVLHNNHQS